MSKKSLQNSFQGGLSLDFPDYQTPQSVYTDAENVAFISHDGNEMILQNEKGTEYRTSLKENYIPLAAKSFNNVAYIVSAEVINGAFTGRGEVGSFPSPNYDSTITDLEGNITGTLINEYKPLQNYLGDGVSYSPLSPPSPSDYGDFNSIHFNFQKNKELEIVAIQPVYDGSINIIFTDHFNPPRCINTRFSVFPDNRFKIIDRKGSGDDNLYHEDNFRNTLNQFLRSNKLVNTQFLGQSNDGQLACGLYRYYIRYATQNKNTTDIIGYSFSIPVFIGDTPASIRGGVTNEPSKRSNILSFTNLDTSYDFIQLSFVYSSGTGGSEAVETAYVIENLYPISSPTLQIKHSGFESVTEINAEELSLRFSTIDTYKTGCEVRGRLFMGNIKSKEYNYKALEEYSQKIQTWWDQIKLDVIGVDQDVDCSELFSTINYSQKDKDGYVGAYYNPRNVHDYLGYWSGESYMFGIVYVFKDGTHSTVFPIRGIDALFTSLGDPTEYSDPSLDYDNDWNNDTGENIRGLFRFPSWKASYPEIEQLLGDDKSLNLFHPVFNFPNPPVEVTEQCIGAFMVRSKRKKDIKAQGIIMDTMIVPLNDYWEKHDGKLSSYNKNGSPDRGYLLSNSKFIPAYNFILEALKRYGVRIRDDLRRVPSDYLEVNDEQGIDPVRFHLEGMRQRSDSGLSFYLYKRYAFLSPEFFTNPFGAQSTLSGSDNHLDTLYQYSNLYSVKTAAAPRNDEAYFSLIKNIKIKEKRDFAFSVDTDWKINNSNTASINGFSTRAFFQAYLRTTNEQADILECGVCQPNREKKMFAEFRLSFNSYLGITIKQDNPPKLLSDPFDSRFATEDGWFLDERNTGGTLYDRHNFTHQDTIDDYSILCNLYTDPNGPRETSRLKEIYQPEYESYFPISQPFYFDRASAEFTEATDPNIIENDTLKCFNGDNFAGVHYRRIFYNSLDYAVQDRQEYKRWVHNGYTMSFVSEANELSYLRNEEIANAEEDGARTFLPFQVTPQSEAGDYRGTGNEWREGRLPESIEYNSGYHNISGENKYINIDSSLPYLQTNFDTRIYFSQEYVSNSFTNNYRVVLPTSYVDYTKKYGEIVAIRNANGRGILCVFENGMALIGVNERSAMAEESGGSILFDAQQVLSPSKYIQLVSDMYGSKWQTSVIQTDNAIYGVDIDKGKIWKFAGGAQIISDFKVQSFLNDLKPIFRDKEYIWLEKQIRTYEDPRIQNVIFTFQSAECAETSFRQEFEGTEAYAETLQVYENGILIQTKPNIESDPDYVPPFMLNSGDSCPSEDLPNCNEVPSSQRYISLAMGWGCLNNQLFIKDACDTSGPAQGPHANCTVSSNDFYHPVSNPEGYEVKKIEYMLPDTEQVANRWTIWGDDTSNGVLSMPLNTLIHSNPPNGYFRVKYLEGMDSDNYAQGGVFFYNNGDILTTRVTVYDHKNGIQSVLKTNAKFSFDYCGETFQSGSALSINDTSITISTRAGSGCASSPSRDTNITLENLSTSTTEFTINDNTNVNELETYTENRIIDFPFKVTIKSTSGGFTRMSEAIGERIPPSNEGDCSRKIIPVWKCRDVYKEVEECISYKYDNKNLIWNEVPMQKWMTFATWHPINMFSIYDKLYSFNIFNNSNAIHEHYASDNYQTYYDELHNFVVEINVNGGTSNIQKIYTNLIIIQNHVYPSEIYYETESDSFKQTIKPRNIVATGADPFKESPQYEIATYDSIYKEDIMYITIVKDQDDTRSLANYINRRVRDKFCKIKLVYKTQDPLIIQAISTNVIFSFS